TENGIVTGGSTLAITPDFLGEVAGHRAARGGPVGGQLIHVLADGMGAKVMPLESIRSCQPRNPASCRLTGADVVFSFSEPKATSTTMEVLVRAVFGDPDPRTQPVLSEVYQVEMSQAADGSWIVSKLSVIQAT
ncbi:MAG: hypothetical protein Q8N53_20235, partial [Longimicrobiales bacterium]|nr:hypothetical protein [Longimicrobiales bacterium]